MRGFYEFSEGGKHRVLGYQARTPRTAALEDPRKRPLQDVGEGNWWRNGGPICGKRRLSPGKWRSHGEARCGLERGRSRQGGVR